MLPSRVRKSELMRSNPRRKLSQLRPSNSHTLSAVAHQILPSGKSIKLEACSGVEPSVEIKGRHLSSCKHAVAFSPLIQRSPLRALNTAESRRPTKGFGKACSKRETRTPSYCSSSAVLPD